MYFIIFACQVLEYQPEPSNNWTSVGELETKRHNHAILSITSELLPCLEGCLVLSKLMKVEYLNVHLVYVMYQKYHILAL